MKVPGKKVLHKRPINAELTRAPLAPSGFTVIELLVVLVILFILAALVILTYSGVQAKNRNAERQTDIETLKSQMESYYAQSNTYPTLDNLNDSAWRAKHLPKLKTAALEDPRWSKKISACTKDNRISLASEPARNCYSYQVTAPDGSACNNTAVLCAHYTLTANLEGGEKYVKSGLN